VICGFFLGDGFGDGLLMARGNSSVCSCVMLLVVFFLFLVKFCFGCVCLCVCVALANFDSFVDGRGVEPGFESWSIC
jgi:hypothetical protein